MECSVKERAYESILPKEEKMTIEVAIEVEEEVVTGAEVEDVEAKEVVAVDEVDSTVAMEEVVVVDEVAPIVAEVVMETEEDPSTTEEDLMEGIVVEDMEIPIEAAIEALMEEVAAAVVVVIMTVEEEEMVIVKDVEEETTTVTIVGEEMQVAEDKATTILAAVPEEIRIENRQLKSSANLMQRKRLLDLDCNCSLVHRQLLLLPSPPQAKLQASLVVLVHERKY